MEWRVNRPHVRLTQAQLNELAEEALCELHKIPLYDFEKKLGLVSEYLKKVESIILDNIKKLPEDDSRSVLRVAMVDRLLNP